MKYILATSLALVLAACSPEPASNYAPFYDTYEVDGTAITTHWAVNLTYAECVDHLLLLQDLSNGLLDSISEDVIFQRGEDGSVILTIYCQEV